VDDLACVGVVNGHACERREVDLGEGALNMVAANGVDPMPAFTDDAGDGRERYPLQEHSTRMRRARRLPVLVMGPRLTVSPVEASDGTEPRYAINSRGVREARSIDGYVASHRTSHIP
jgi:hypothetical protein